MVVQHASVLRVSCGWVLQCNNRVRSHWAIRGWGLEPGGRKHFTCLFSLRYHVPCCASGCCLLSRREQHWGGVVHGSPPASCTLPEWRLKSEHRFWTAALLKLYCTKRRTNKAKGSAQNKITRSRPLSECDLCVGGRRVVRWVQGLAELPRGRLRANAVKER